MDYPVAHAEAVRPWRTATLVASAIAALELVLLIVAGIVLLGKSLAAHGHAGPAKAHPGKTAAGHAPAAATPHRVVRVVARLPRARTHVLVLNGNGVQGAAAQMASLVRARGYQVQGAANAPHAGYPTTLVMYRPGYAGEARRFGHDLNLQLVEPLDGMQPRQLHGAQIVVILGDSR